MSNIRKTIHGVRALVKIFSALTDIDNVIHNDKFAYNLKKDLPGFQEELEKLTYETSKQLVKSSEDTLALLIKNFDNFSESIHIKNSYITSVNLFLAKLESAKNDLEKMQNTNTHWVIALIQKIESFSNKKYLNQFTSWEDVEGNTYYSLVKELDSITKALIKI
jgi:hypothetical protein